MLLPGPTTIRREDDIMNIKDIAATLAILGSGALVMTGCGKEKPATETPGGAEATPEAGGDAAEAKCGEGHTEEGHCGAAEEAAGGEGDAAAEGSCGGAAKEGGEGSCGGK